MSERNASAGHNRWHHRGAQRAKQQLIWRSRDVIAWPGRQNSANSADNTRVSCRNVTIGT